jgi:hypothetical protein
MKINLRDIDRESFYVTEHILGGESVYLVTPKQINCVWTKENVIFRSSVWDKDGLPVSISFLKFCNWGEKPEIFPVPINFDKCSLINKEDGSTLIFSLWKDNLIVRTRGTINARNQENGDEIDLFLNRYPQIHQILYSTSVGGTSDISLIFEWNTPTNPIVLRHGEPDIILTGMIHHYDYSYENQNSLDMFAKSNGFKRPVRYTFDSMAQMLEKLPTMTGIEGICVYHNNDQSISKLKTEEYLKLHRFKANANFESTVDLFFEFGMPEYGEFQTKLIEKFDFECANMVLGFTSIICDGMKEVNKLVDAMKVRVEPLKLLSRKDAAEKIFQMWGKETNRSGFAFKILNSKSLTKEDLKKLLYQITKN